MEFSSEDVTRIVPYMARLSEAEDGWINLVPNVTRDDERPTSLRFLTLLSGGATGDTMGTWVPRSHNRHGPVPPSVGITHTTGHRVFAELNSLDLPVPRGWFVEQDHPRRGLVLRVPFEVPHEQVLSWSLRAVDALGGSRRIMRWRADLYLPIDS